MWDTYYWGLSMAQGDDFIGNFLGVCAVGLVVFGILAWIFHPLFEHHGHLTLDATDRSIMTAHVTVQCRAEEGKGGSLLIGPPCGQRRKAGVLLFEIEGLPSVIVQNGSPYT